MSRAALALYQRDLVFGVELPQLAEIEDRVDGKAAHP
jgi:hypothetical protein